MNSTEDRGGIDAVASGSGEGVLLVVYGSGESDFEQHLSEDRVRAGVRFGGMEV